MTTLLRWLPLSIALHAAAVGGAAWVVREVAGPALFVDLTLADAEDDTRPPAAGAAPAAPAAAPSPARAEPPVIPAPAPAPSVVPAPSGAPTASGAPTPSVAPAPEAPSVLAADVAEPRAATADAPVVARSADGGASSAPSGAGDATARGTAPTASASDVGGGSAGGVARGGGAGEGMLALALPGDGGAGGYGPYLALLRRRVQESLTYPAAARRRGLSGTVHLDITLEPSGTISAVALVRSSSHALLDDAALEAVRGLGRVPFPPDVRPRALRVRLPVVFELR